MPQLSVDVFLEQNQRDIEHGLGLLVGDAEPRGLYGPVKHVLDSKGKRFRPHLALCAADMFGGNRNAAERVALAMEVFHVFTLVHDDIMDHSDSRRGRETIHVKWDEPTAILAGDFLLGKAWDLISALPDASLRKGLNTFGDTVRILCEGQIRDMEFENRSDVSLDEYLEMIDQKTSALLKASLELGALTGEVSDADIGSLRSVGYHLGRAFQIQDDLLDLTAESHSWGKPVGGDLISGKKAFLLLEALNVERQHGKGYFHDVARQGGLDSGNVDHARNLMKEMGVLETARSAVRHHSREAQSLLSGFDPGLGRDTLNDLIGRMAARLY